VETYKTEEQQVEELKHWWAKNGKATIAAGIVGLGVILGGRAWVDYRHTQSENASTLYESMIAAMKVANLDSALEQASRLLGQYSSTPYATLAALASAKIKADQKDSAAARAHLQWVIDHGEPEPMTHVARLRLARLMLDAGETPQALSTLGTPPPGFVMEYKELEGDIHRAMNNVDAARAAYRDALLGATAQVRDRSVLEMKLEDVGGEVPKPEAAR
jgi:predicted negative regulator of RcsB-dependent stress response